MRKKQIRNRISEVIKKIEDKYNSVIFDYYYDKLNNEHWILHNDLDLDTDDKFLEFVGKYFDKLFHDKGIFNIFVGYDRNLDFVTVMENYENSFNYIYSNITTKFKHSSDEINITYNPSINILDKSNLEKYENDKPSAVKMKKRNNFLLAA